MGEATIDSTDKPVGAKSKKPAKKRRAQGYYMVTQRFLFSCWVGWICGDTGFFNFVFYASSFSTRALRTFSNF